jgi:chemotaxis protein methyltransferase CheR
VRVWSAACSTGDEAYSLAMVLLDHFPPADGWHVEVLATDISTRALARAQAGVWSVEQAKHIPDRYLKRFMHRGTRSQQGKMRAGAEVRAVTTFRRLNLQAASYAVVGLCDLVVCRNALMYFSVERRGAVVSRLLLHLAPRGYLLVGHAESLARVTNEVRAVHPTIYQRPDTGISRRPEAARGSRRVG